MATIEEDFVSFETAKLLKEKGFDESCYTYYDDIDDTINRFDKGYHFNNTSYPWGVPYDVNKAKKYVVAPTLQMAVKWLRDEHNLCIEPYRTACGYLYTISSIPYGSCKCNPKEGGDDEDSGQWTTYEGAVEAAIKYCLKNLI